jgi:hypothetical protein
MPPAGITLAAKVLPCRSRRTSKRIRWPGTTDDIVVQSLPVTWAANSDRDPSSLSIARPWPRSNDLSIAIAMKVALEVMPHAKPAQEEGPAAYEPDLGGPGIKSRDGFRYCPIKNDLSRHPLRSGLRSKAAALDLCAPFIHFIWRISGFRLEILSAVGLLSAVAVFSKVGHDLFRLRTSWSRAPAGGVQPGHPFNLPASATSAAASRARGNRNASGADGCRHGRFDNSFHPRLGTHRPTVTERSAWNQYQHHLQNVILSSNKLPTNKARR